MPRRVVHNNIVFLAVIDRVVFEKIAQGIDNGFKIEHFWSVYIQFAGFRNDISRISRFVPAGVRFDFWSAAASKPFSCDQSIDGEMHLVLEYKNCIGIAL